MTTRDLPFARAQIEIDKTRNIIQRSSVSNALLDNYLQYGGCDEIDWITPSNFNLGTMGGCLTVSEMEQELDDMRTYSQTNSLDIISVKASAHSGSLQKQTVILIQMVGHITHGVHKQYTM